MKANSPNKVAIIMGSKNDYPVMRKCEQILKKFKVKNDVLIVSAHRTPERLFKFAKNAHKNNTTLKEEVLKLGIFTEKDYDKLMKPILMTKPK